MQHWLEALAMVFGPHAQIVLNINTMREVTLIVTGTAEGMEYELAYVIPWDDFENTVADPLISSTDLIIEEWRQLLPSEGGENHV